MFENIEALDKNKHQDLKFTPVRSYSFARDVNMVPLSYSEIIRASRFFPIVFPSQGHPLPQAVLSLTRGRNTFVDQDGNWLAPYVPAYIRRYPFILAKTDEQGHYAVCIDPEAPQLSTDQGDPLYTANFEPSETLTRTMDFLKRYHQEMMETERLFADFHERGLLVERQFTVQKEGQTSNIGGFRAVDENGLKELENDVLAEWVKKGLMGLVYAHLFSLDNARTLVTSS